MKRDEVKGLAPPGDLGLIGKSSFLFDSLFLFDPNRKGVKCQRKSVSVYFFSEKDNSQVSANSPQGQTIQCLEELQNIRDLRLKLYRSQLEG